MAPADVKSSANVPTEGVHAPARKKYNQPHITDYGTLAALTGSPSPTEQGGDTGGGGSSGGSSAI